MRKLALLVSVLIACVTVNAATLTVPCDFVSISNALCVTAQEGDDVFIQAGTCTISNQITVNRNISFRIRGAGTNETTLISGPGLGYAISILSSSTNTFFIHDMNCVGAAPNSSGFLVIGNSAIKFRGYYNIYNIKMTNIMTRGISVGFGDSYGVVHHCHMVANADGNQLFDFEGMNYSSWSNAVPFGSMSNSVVEDCYLEKKPPTSGNGFFDAYTGAQFVFRNNFCVGGAATGGHGYDSSVISPRSWEVYNNVFTNGESFVTGLSFRGGTGLIYSNKFYDFDRAISISYMRSDPTNNPNAGLKGIPGRGYIINFNGTAMDGIGRGITLPGNPTNTQQLAIGVTKYHFITNLTNATFAMYNNSGYGGGAVLIGSTVAETITNLYKAVNVVPGGYGTAFTNWASLPFNYGYDFLAVGIDTANANLILTNALDSNTDEFGWPANQQTGVITSYPLTGTNFINNQMLYPAYVWSNTLDSVSQGYAWTGDAVGGYTTNVLKLGRDIINDAWPTNYTPLAYPHPLITGYIPPDPDPEPEPGSTNTTTRAVLNGTWRASGGRIGN